MSKLLRILAPVFCLFFVLQSNLLQAQSIPDAISYQAVARDNNGSPLITTNLNVRLGILADEADGELVYEEEHLVSTSELGLFDLMIGNGTNTGNGQVPTITQISWQNGTYFLKVEVDQGLGFEEIGTSQFLTVPFAFYSQLAKTALDVNDADANPNNELITDFTLTNSSLTITEAGESFSVDILPAFQDLDNDTTNEAISVIELDGTDLNVTEGSISFVVPLESLVDDGDWNQTTSGVHNTTDNIGIGTNNPQSTLELNGSMGVNFISASGPQTVILDETHHVILANVTSGDVTVSLPSASSCPGRIYILKRYAIPPTEPVQNDLIIETSGSETVDGFLNPGLSGFERNNATVLSDGSNWWVIEGKVTGL
jgi:hypothetical protein